MNKNPLIILESLGQSIWLDYIRRHLIESGELERLIDEDGVTGVTSNPAIFEKAIAGSHDYDSMIARMHGQSPQAIYNALSIEDIQLAAEKFRPIYDRTQGKDGFVSLEVSPELARDTEGTLQEARRLWQEVNRPNVLIKIPATQEGLPAIRQAISEGININVTLLFGLPRYQEVAEAYIAGLETRLAQGKPIDGITSIASFFLSRIDILVDPMLETQMADSNPKQIEAAKRAYGQVAIACARKAYQIYKELYKSERYQKLLKEGARPQRLLWASTSTKNPTESDVKYVEALIGADTINTLPMETIHAYRDHGHPKRQLENGLKEATQILESLSSLNIDLAAVTQQLEEEGIRKFVQPFVQLKQSIAEKSNLVDASKRVDPQQYSLGDFEGLVTKKMDAMQNAQFVQRFWKKDPSLWKTDPANQAIIRNGMGWLQIAEIMEARLGEIQQFVKAVQKDGFQYVLLLGMGGSSLAPLVLQHIFRPVEGFLNLSVLDSTDPETISHIEQNIPLDRTLFIVASKSGTTAEPIALQDYFYAKVRELKGDHAGEHFIAITDPETELVEVAKARQFRKVFLNFKDIGGRFSALSYFGIIPAALMGIPVDELLARAKRMHHACESCVPIRENPGFQLGIVMGTLAQQGRNKITFLVEPPLETFGLWLEQLVAESTGKEGRGLLPIANESLGKPSVYGADRLFVHIYLKGQTDANFIQKVQALQADGHPIVNIELMDRLDLGQEFLRWEIATAVAGSILEINPFDQPNVQESKDNTKRLLKDVISQGCLPKGTPLLTEAPLELFTNLEVEKNASIAEVLNHWLALGKPGDYIALMAYLYESPEVEDSLQNIRLHLRDSQRLATTLGYGPRFLHSTGQYHKGGPNNGLFLQLTAQDTVQIPIPDRPYDFGVLKRAEALGDLQSLQAHGRRVIQIDLGTDVLKGLTRLRQLIDEVVLTRK